MNKEISCEQLLYCFEHDSTYPIDETVFYFDDDPEEEHHYIGCLRQFEEPYWAGYCDIPDGCEFRTAQELFTAKIYNHQSIKDRWEHLVLVELAQIPVSDWIKTYLHSIP